MKAVMMEYKGRSSCQTAVEERRDQGRDVGSVRLPQD